MTLIPAAGTVTAAASPAGVTTAVAKETFEQEIEHVGADVLHLGQDDLPVPVARRILGPEVIIGRSSHSPAQSDAAAAEPGVDYFCAGPTWATPTKPGRPAAGPGLLAHVARTHPARPWFAIGGISLDRLGEVLAAGATRVVVVRAITEADDPAAATRAFARRLRPT